MFWRNLYDQFKDRRYAALFLMALLASIALAVPAAKIYEAWRSEYLLYLWPGIGLLAAGFGWSVFRRARARRRNRWNYRPLSCDEVCVARSKLLRDRNVRNL